MAEAEALSHMFKLILIDWFKCSAKVTLTLRSGAQFTGTITKHISTTIDYVALEDEPAYGQKQVKHDVALEEIAAITAVAR